MYFNSKILSLPILLLCSIANAQWNATGNSSSGTQGSTVISNSTASKPYWFQSIKHQGVAAFRKDSTYQVFRNVKEFGAKGLQPLLPDLEKQLLTEPKGMASATILRRSISPSVAGIDAGPNYANRRRQAPLLYTSLEDLTAFRLRSSTFITRKSSAIPTICLSSKLLRISQHLR